MEFRSTELFPNYNYEQSLLIVGVYRPPDAVHPPYKEALEGMLQRYHSQEVATLIAGDLNINSWGKEYYEWVEREELWVLAGPRTPTHRSCTTDDTMLVAVGGNLPEGLLPGAAETDKELEKAEFYSVYTTEDPVIADHMALTLVLHTSRLDRGGQKRRYNVYGLNPHGVEKQRSENL